MRSRAAPNSICSYAQLSFSDSFRHTDRSGGTPGNARSPGGTRLLRWSGASNGIGSHHIASENAGVSQIGEPSHRIGFARVRHKKTLFRTTAPLLVRRFEDRAPLFRTASTLRLCDNDRMTESRRKRPQRRSPVSCPVCQREVLQTNQFVCFDVQGHTCRKVDLKDVPRDTTKMICCVHETCAEEFKKMVASGQYRSKDSN